MSIGTEVVTNNTHDTRIYASDLMHGTRRTYTNTTDDDVFYLCTLKRRNTYCQKLGLSYADAAMCSQHCPVAFHCLFEPALYVWARTQGLTHRVADMPQHQFQHWTTQIAHVPARYLAFLTHVVESCLLATFQHHDHHYCDSFHIGVVDRQSVRQTGALSMFCLAASTLHAQYLDLMRFHALHLLHLRGPLTHAAPGSLLHAQRGHSALEAQNVEP